MKRGGSGGLQGGVDFTTEDTENTEKSELLLYLALPSSVTSVSSVV